MIIKNDVSLKPFNTFGISATSKYFTRIEKIADLQTLLKTSVYQQTPNFILGGGSNVLFTQDFEGLVLHNALTGIEKVRETTEHIWIKAYSGEVWHDLVLYCVENNWGGIENLSLIPGSGASDLFGELVDGYGREFEGCC
ncbi:MAG: FAD-binding protein [Chitinophagales bacterium]